MVMRPGGKYALQNVKGVVGPGYSTFYRMLMNRVHQADCVRKRDVEKPLVEMAEGAGIVVGKTKVREVTVTGMAGIRYRISNKDHSRCCFVVQEGAELFLAPSLERDGQPYTFKTLRALVKHYALELAWLQSGASDVPKECEWLEALFTVEPENGFDFE